MNSSSQIIAFQFEGFFARFGDLSFAGGASEGQFVARDLLINYPS